VKVALDCALQGRHLVVEALDRKIWEQQESRFYVDGAQVTEVAFLAIVQVLRALQEFPGPVKEVAIGNP
jgi:hypothetical protein